MKKRPLVDGGWIRGDFEGHYEASGDPRGDHGVRALSLRVVHARVRDAVQSVPPPAGDDVMRQPSVPAWVDFGDGRVHDITLNDVHIVGWRNEALVDDLATARGLLRGTLYARASKPPLGCLPWLLLVLLLLALIALAALFVPSCHDQALRMRDELTHAVTPPHDAGVAAPSKSDAGPQAAGSARGGAEGEGAGRGHRGHGGGDDDDTGSGGGCGGAGRGNGAGGDGEGAGRGNGGGDGDGSAKNAHELRGDGIRITVSDDDDDAARRGHRAHGEKNDDTAHPNDESNESASSARSSVRSVGFDLDSAMEHPDQILTCGRRITLSSDLLFDHDHDDLRPDSIPTLKKVSRLIHASSKRDLVLDVVGYTDSTGSEWYNDGLSLRRAKTVARFLRDEHALDTEHIKVAGKGSRDPIVPNGGTVEQQSPNRRVELIVDCAR